MKNKYIKDFWENNPVGENLIIKELDWNKHFQKYDDYRYKTESHILFELDKIDFKEKKVLEIGIGQASDSEQIIKRGGKWNGLDLTEASIERAKMRFKIKKLKFEEIKLGSCTKIPWPDNYFDLIYSHGVLHHVPEIKLAQEEISRVLKSEGKLIIMLYNKISLNYYLSISVIRRLGLLFIFLLNHLKLYTPSENTVFHKHLMNLKKKGIKNYFNMKNFINYNTDGPNNPYSKVYTKSIIANDFSKFYITSTNCHFLNERHFPGIKILPIKIRNFLSSKFGWHLWANLKNNETSSTK